MGSGPGRFLPAVLLAAALLAPAEQARLHTTVGLQKHVVFGAWFAAIAAGYALARLSRVDRGYGWAPVMALPIAAATLFGSMGQAHSLHRDWPDATALVKVLRPAVRAQPGNYLAEDDDVEAYYLRTAGALAGLVRHLLLPVRGPARGRGVVRGRDRAALLRAGHPGLRGHRSGRRADHRGPAAHRRLPRAGPRGPVHGVGEGGGAMLVTDSANTEPATLGR